MGTRRWAGRVLSVGVPRWRHGTVVERRGRCRESRAPATGYWHYNGTTGAYGPAGTTESETVLSWAQFASTLGVEPGDWPLLGYRAAEH